MKKLLKALVEWLDRKWPDVVTVTVQDYTGLKSKIDNAWAELYILADNIKNMQADLTELKNLTVRRNDLEDIAVRVVKLEAETNKFNASLGFNSPFLKQGGPFQMNSIEMKRLYQETYSDYEEIVIPGKLVINISTFKFPEDKKKILKLSYDEKMAWYVSQNPREMIYLGNSPEFQRFWKWHVLYPIKLKRLYFKIKNWEFRKHATISEIRGKK